VTSSQAAVFIRGVTQRFYAYVANYANLLVFRQGNTAAFADTAGIVNCKQANVRRCIKQHKLTVS
jgi:hypothetical protein